jgi:hypothetical protein
MLTVFGDKTNLYRGIKNQWLTINSREDNKDYSKGPVFDIWR